MQGLSGGPAADALTLEYNSNGQLQIKDLGVTAAKLAADAVTTAKILDANVTTAKIADANVSNAKLKTSQGEISHNGAVTYFTLPGGEYGFYPQTKVSGSVHQASVISLKAGGHSVGPGASYLTQLMIYAGNSETYSVQQRYVTASGLDHWLFLVVHKGTGAIVSAYQAPDHPAYGNGGDVGEIPHPFRGVDLGAYEIVLVDDAQTKTLKEQITRQNSLLDIVNGTFKVDRSKAKTYKPLHTGLFLPDGKPDILTELPAGIVVRELITK